MWNIFNHMNGAKSILSLIRLQDQIFIIIAILIGSFLHSFSLSDISLPLIFFIIFLSSFTFAIDDIADIKIDRLSEKTRNPIVLKQISLSFAKFLSFIFFILASFTSFLLPFNLFYLSVFLLFISITYSFFIRAKSNPPLDLIYHGLSPAIIFVMISSLYKSFDLTIFFVSLIIFSMFMLIQLLQEIRDFSSDRKLIKTTAIILGKRNSIKLSIILLLSLLLIVLTGIIMLVFPISSLLYLPLSYFLFFPLMKGLKDKRYESTLLNEFRKNLIIVTIIFFMLFLVSMFF